MTTMTMRSYASDALYASSQIPQWLLYVRHMRCGEDQPSDAFVFSVVVPTDDSKCAMFETTQDRDAMEQHIDELGIEVTVAAYVELLLKTLSMRKCIDVAMDEEAPERALVVLTYQFSETISRKGRVELRRSSSDLPWAVASLLLDLHAVENEPQLTEMEKVKAQAKRLKHMPMKLSGSTDAKVSLSQESTASSDGDLSMSQTQASSSHSATNPQLLKKRHMPTGIVRRKGPRGAKLAKLG